VEIEDAAMWSGADGALIEGLLRNQLLDENDNEFSIHDWKEHQRWAYFALERKAQSRKANDIKYLKKRTHSPDRSPDRSPERCTPASPPASVAVAVTASQPLVQDQDQHLLIASPPEGNNGSGAKPTKWANLVSWNRTTGCFEGITEMMFDKWATSYPAVDINIQLNRADEWLKANPTKMKKNYYRFIVNWLSRAQERGGR